MMNLSIGLIQYFFSVDLVSVLLRYSCIRTGHIRFYAYFETACSYMIYYILISLSILNMYILITMMQKTKAVSTV